MKNQKVATKLKKFSFYLTFFINLIILILNTWFYFDVNVLISDDHDSTMLDCFIWSKNVKNLIRYTQ